MSSLVRRIQRGRKGLGSKLGVRPADKGENKK
jgi:hypothetical protein